jgi:hypothetical protein
LNRPVLFRHFLQEKFEGLGANDLTELGLVVVQDADPVPNDVIENPSLGRWVHQVSHRDVLVGADDGGVHPGVVAFPAFLAVLYVFLFQEVEDQPGVRMLKQVAEGAGEFLLLATS